MHSLLTGAGVSTESGLPDYRGVGGLWGTRRFEELASIELWRREPEEFWQFYAQRLAGARRRRSRMPGTSRSPSWSGSATSAASSHRTSTASIVPRAVASRWSSTGRLPRSSACSCGFRGSSEIAEAQLRENVAVPACPACSANLKPAVVLFGELLPPALSRAHAALEECDLLICCGSSLQVYPVAGFPVWVHEQGGTIAIVNLGPTGADRRATVRLELKSGRPSRRSSGASPVYSEGAYATRWSVSRRLSPLARAALSATVTRCVGVPPYA